MGADGAVRGSEGRAIVTVVLIAFGGVYLLGGGRTWAVPAVAVLLGLQMWWVWGRPGRWIVVAQAVVAYAAVGGFEVSVGMLGTVAGVVGVLGWRWVAGLVVASAGVIEGVRETAVPVDAVITAGLVGLIVYGIVKLAQRAEEMEAARPALTMAAVSRERLRIADSLNAELGQGLGAIAHRCQEALADREKVGEAIEVARRVVGDARAVAADFRSRSLAPEMTTARALLGSAGIDVQVSVGHQEPLGAAGALLATVLKEAVTDVVRQGSARECQIETRAEDGRIKLRVVNDGVRTVELGADGLGEAQARIEEAGGTLTAALEPDGRFTVEATVRQTRDEAAAPDQRAYRFSLALLVALLLGFCVKALLLVPWGWQTPIAAACLAGVAVLQLQWRTPRRPKAWKLKLAVYAALTYLPMIWFGSAWLGVPGFFAGALMVAFNRPLMLAAVMATVAAIGTAQRLEPGEIVNYTISTLVSALVVYALVRLAQLVKELQEAGDELARAAAVQERLRTARDLHDILGHTLAAILLKCELARRLPEERARRELEEVVDMAGRAQIELSPAPSTLDAELASAKSVLAAADVTTTIDAAHDGIPKETETVFGVIVREAVTNILRHTTATHCHIITGPSSISIENDGAQPLTRPPGSGLGNLTTRLAELGGTLTITRAGDRFRLDAKA